MQTRAEVSSSEDNTALEKKRDVSLLSERYVIQTMPPVLGKFDMTVTAIMALFLLTNAVSGAAGGPVSLVYLGIGALVFFAPCIVATIELGVQLPYEGSLYNWTTRALNRFMGFFIGLCFWVTGVLAVITAGSAFVTTLQGLNTAWLALPWQQGVLILVLIGLFAAGIYFFGALTLDCGGFLVIGLLASQVFATYLNLNLPFWVFGLISLVLIFTLNYLGIRLTTRVQLALSALSVLPLLLLAIVIIAHGGDSGNTLQAFNPASVPATPTSVPAAGIFPGILFAITLFIGFETSASLGEETRDPRKSIPRAVIGTVIITGVFYLLVIYASDIGFGLANSAKWASDPAPLDTLATRYVGSWLAVLVDIAVLFDALVVMSAFMATTSRGLFALARHELLPGPLAHVSPRFRTPLGGLIFVSVVALLLLVLVAITTASGGPTAVLTVFGIMSTVGSLLIELIYIGLCLAAVRLLLEDPTKWWHWLFLLVAVITPILGIYGSVVPFPTWPQSLGIYISLAVIVLSLAWTLVNRYLFPLRLGKASEPHPWEVEDVEPDAAPAS